MLASPSSTLDGVEVLRLTTEASLEQYVKLYLRLPIAPTRIGPIARIFDYVANAAPGVREILTLGKIAWEARDGGWDVVVVDGPATGHVIELMAAADNLGDLIGFGPLADQTAWISELVADPVRTMAWVVTNAEELPVSETFELLARLDAETNVTVAGIVMNRMPPRAANLPEASALVAGGGGLGLAVAAALVRTAAAERQRSRLDGLVLPVITVVDSDDPVEAVVAAWSDQ
ncbi:MAG: anion-transporting ArsA/GET3 family ATPase [Acidimicrobiales bacterium]|jgi:anion-transporting  ArsA/GET3 family ATPase